MHPTWACRNEGSTKNKITTERERKIGWESLFGAWIANAVSNLLCWYSVLNRSPWIWGWKWFRDFSLSLTLHLPRHGAHDAMDDSDLHTDVNRRLRNFAAKTTNYLAFKWTIYENKCVAFAYECSYAQHGLVWNWKLKYLNILVIRVIWLCSPCRVCIRMLCALEMSILCKSTFGMSIKVVQSILVFVSKTVRFRLRKKQQRQKTFAELILDISRASKWSTLGSPDVELFVWKWKCFPLSCENGGNCWWCGGEKTSRLPT